MHLAHALNTQYKNLNIICMYVYVFGKSMVCQKEI